MRSTVSLRAVVIPRIPGNFSARPFFCSQLINDSH